MFGNKLWFETSVCAYGRVIRKRFKQTRKSRERERERRTGQEGINHEVSNFSGREREVGRKDSETPKS